MSGAYDGHSRVAARVRSILGFTQRPSAATEERARYTPRGLVERCQECGCLCDAAFVQFGVCRECQLMEVKP